jgi:hypothetical protein
MLKMQSEHFRIHGNLIAEIRPLREALLALVSELLPRSTTPTQMMGYNRAWQLTAQALYGITPNAEFSGEEGRSPTDSAGTPGYTSLEKA